MLYTEGGHITFIKKVHKKKFNTTCDLFRSVKIPLASDS